MTAAVSVANAPSTLPTGNVPKSSSLTRKSIRKFFPLGAIMSKGCNNPLTLHSVNEEVFPRMWSFLAEVMIVEGELTRSTKEAVALMVSQKNHCPMCVTAHRMIGTAAKRAESTKDTLKQEQQMALHNAAMDYAEQLIEETLHSSSSGSGRGDDDHDDDYCMLEEALDNFDVSRLSTRNIMINLAPAAATEGDANALLTAVGRAEVALVVVLYNHMNRIISAVLGEQMSTAMFSVPRSAARKMESTSVMGVVNKMMAPVLAGGMKRKHRPGITASLFPTGSSCLDFMPSHMMGAELAGTERAEALSRLVAWVTLYEKQILEEGIVSPEVIELLDDPNNAPQDLRTHKIAEWATGKTMRDAIHTALSKKTSRAIANVLLLVSYTPQSAFNSIHWKTLLKALGSDQSKTLVIWWSLRFTFRRTKGLRLPRQHLQTPGW